jgi:hypothetical protein
LVGFERDLSRGTLERGDVGEAPAAVKLRLFGGDPLR